ncbi:MAG: thymidine phosphorylase [Acidimicrobiales bacterium]|nr:thymidine phosphorylase [Acidimicrobiales bacterium]
MATDVLDVIRTKRDGGRLTDEQIRFFVDGYTAGTIADEQASALLMAVLFRGLDPGELATWTARMIESGERLDLSAIGRPTVDKHSTGGVGDKISLPLCPLVAACGAAVPQLAGRGLGHTGGTLDKLEAIAGFRTSLGVDELRAQLASVGAVICGAGAGLAPADRKLYALRDVTGTVESIPLIASSIMSKKIAEGTSALVLDVKVGSGAFLPEIDRARRLAETMVELGRSHGVATVALLTAMDQPLGQACGNGIEVTESLEVLGGGGPADVVELTVVLAREMLGLVGIDTDPALALADGSARRAWDAMVRAQGGDPGAPLPIAPLVRPFAAPATGWVQRLDARAVGVAAWRLGAGRARKEDLVSAVAGVRCLAKVGDRVEAGQPWLELHADDEQRLASAEATLMEALADGRLAVGPAEPEPAPLVIERIG